jgi:RimJ/RimL family protein N-acetyltransferase
MLLETPRLLLRDFTADDWPAVLAYQRDPRYLRLYEWADRTPAAVQAFVQMFVDQQHAQPRTRFQLAVTLRATGELIGNCGIRRDSPMSHEAEIGYEIAPDQWGRGYASEAVAAIVGFGIETLRVHRITAWLVADNVASARVLEKNGFQLEGRLRDKEMYKGRYWDVLMYARLVDIP